MPAVNLIAKFPNDESAALAIEQGPIAAGISLAAIMTVTGLSSRLNGSFTAIKAR